MPKDVISDDVSFPMAVLDRLGNLQDAQDGDADDEHLRPAYAY